ncbi:MAG: hypothetical protein JO112_23595, partial [Planctomycetes bacterium]|nr:hypothetical protein [Planctomycetota bacterium]
FGTVHASANEELNLQLRIELLRQTPIFGQQETQSTIDRLEAIVKKYLEMKKKYEQRLPVGSHLPGQLAGPDQQAFDRDKQQFEQDFHEVLIQGAMDHAKNNHLAVSPQFSLRLDDKYYIDGELLDRKQVTFEKIKRLVSTYYDKGWLEYQEPFNKINHDPYLGKTYVTFNSGNVVNGPKSNPTVEALFDLELLRRYPNIDSQLLSPYFEKVETMAREQFEKERNQTVASILAGIQQGNGLNWQWVIKPAYVEYCKQHHLEEHQHSDHRSVLIEPNVTIKTDPKVKKIIIISALVYLLADNGKWPISPLDIRIKGPGDQPDFAAGKYMYKLEYQDGTASDYSSFLIPDDLDRNGDLELH